MASTTGGMTARITVITAIALLALTGCKDTAHPTASTAPSRSTSSSSASATPEATAHATAAPSQAAGTPLGVGCEQLVSLQQMYDFNPNFSLDADYTPKSGSSASAALKYRGIACNWVNQTSGETISFAAAHPAASDLAALKRAAASGTAVSGLGDAAWFSKSGETGELQVFRGPYWVTATSVFFGTADDAKQLAEDAVAAVK
ncbi:hypothetical protein [Parafrigoribacterium soli]|uniref:hypothetical protein n=1 Tax=Parafrigoribacterium soli TaxID=3144663 RepID=UPI0032F00DC0